MRESSVKTRDDLAETGLGQRVNIEGTQVETVGLFRELQGDWETQERIVTGLSDIGGPKALLFSSRVSGWK